MFANDKKPNDPAFTINNSNNLVNKHSSEKDNLLKEPHDFSKSKSREVIITKHLCDPCPRLYTDIFKTFVIICRDPSHGRSKAQAGLGADDKAK